MNNEDIDFCVAYAIAKAGLQKCECCGVYYKRHKLKNGLCDKCNPPRVVSRHTTHGEGKETKRGE